MANFRQIHTQIWKDDWFIDLSPEEKILFIYLFSNDSSTICGLYKISIRIMSFETGLDEEFIKNALAKFETDRKVVYRDGVVWVVNMRRYHSSESPKIKSRMSTDEKIIQDCKVKEAYLHHKNTGEYPTDIISIPYGYPSREKEKEKEKEKILASSASSEATPPFSSPEADKPEQKQGDKPKKPSKKNPLTDHPAIKAIKTVTNRNPRSETYEFVISTLGNEPNIDRLKECYQIWVRRGSNPMNIEGYLDWYIHGIPPKNGNGHKPQPQPDYSRWKSGAEGIEQYE